MKMPNGSIEYTYESLNGGEVPFNTMSESDKNKFGLWAKNVQSSPLVQAHANLVSYKQFHKDYAAMTYQPSKGKDTFWDRYGMFMLFCGIILTGAISYKVWELYAK
jgi:hypothetical protein